MEVGWYNYQHLPLICDNLIRGNYSDAMQRIELWQIRGVIPAAVAATQIIIRELSADNLDCTNCLHFNDVLHKNKEKNSLLCMAFIRSLNLLVDQGQTMIYSKSISTIAKEIGIPEELIQLRHDCCHGNLPDLYCIYQANRYLLHLLIHKYWIPQSELIQSFNSTVSSCHIIKSLIDGQTSIIGYNNDKFVAMVTLDLLVSSDANVIDKRLAWVNEIILKRGLDFALNLYSRAIALLLNLDGWSDNHDINLDNPKDYIGDYSWRSFAARLDVYKNKFEFTNTNVRSNSFPYGHAINPLLELLNITNTKSLDRIQQIPYYLQCLHIMSEYLPDKLIISTKGLMDYCSKMIRSGYTDLTEIRKIWFSWKRLRNLVRLNCAKGVDWEKVDILISVANKAITPHLDDINMTDCEINIQNADKTYVHLLSVGTYFCGRTWCLVSDELHPSIVFSNIID